MIEFKNVSKVYADGTQAIKDFSLQVKRGEILTLIGPSGCGKTTTMKMINRLIEPSSGAIYIDDKNIKDYNIHELRWNIGYVLQQIALFPHMTIEENISIVPEMKKWGKKKLSSRIDELLEMVGLEPSIYKKRMPSELSGGQQQRIGVIRALAADPDIILMDEPFSALDPLSREQLQMDIRKLQQEIKKTIVFVTHDMDEALKLGDRICVMKEGEIVRLDAPDRLVMQPGSEFVEEFIGNRKSPWQTSVGNISSTDKQYIISSSDFADSSNLQPGTFIMTDENGIYQHMLINGKAVHGPVIDSAMSLYESAELIKDSSQTIFPVVENQKLVSVLTYRDMMEFLLNQANMENGVVRP